ncbi:endonuclease domain-containing protein [Adlercreutzia sp. ZJ154]|uniref:endonuclease domain-containing protein n=1 Tax=Adlercreutzia sp. ZJ154 TaxID=2709790 RepID=UPI0013E9EEC7|nr:endonuclease domain-containing protein [Adlercreutzia sp. ZJ154]
MCSSHRHIMAERAKELRNNMTWAEKKLWYKFLREYEPRFCAQKVVGNYILDFYCNKVRLCIELDGDSHYNTRAIRYDEIRTLYLEMEEIEVLRFTNTDIKESFEGVCVTIDQAVKRRRNDLSNTLFAALRSKH